MKVGFCHLTLPSVRALLMESISLWWSLWDFRSSEMLRSLDLYSYRRFGTTYRSHIQGSNIPMGCFETSVQNYHSTTLRNIPEERRSLIHRGGCLKSRILGMFLIPEIRSRALVFWDKTASYPLLSASELDSPSKGRDVTIKVSSSTSAGKGNWHEKEK